MTDIEKLEVLRKAYELACRWITENPPGDLNMYFDKPGYINALLANDERAWQTLFLKEAIQKEN